MNFSKVILARPQQESIYWCN